MSIPLPNLLIANRPSAEWIAPFTHHCCRTQIRSAYDEHVVEIEFRDGMSLYGEMFGAGFEAVTNQIPTIGKELFIRLIITEE